MFNQYEQIVNAVYDELYEVNISRDWYQISFSHACMFMTPEKQGHIDQAVSYVANSLIFSQDKEKFAKLFDVENVRKRFGRGEEVLSEEVRKLCIDGKYRWARIEIYKKPRHEDEEEIFFCLVKNVDDTRSEFENNKELRDEWSHIVMKHSDVMVFDYDVKLDCLEYSVRLQGKEKKSVRISDYLNYLPKTKAIHPDSIADFKELLENTSRQQTHGTFEICAQLFDKDYSWYRIHYTSLANDNGEVYRIIGTLKDISDLKEMTSQNNQLMQIIHCVFQKEYDGCVIIDVDTGKYSRFHIQETIPNQSDYAEYVKQFSQKYIAPLGQNDFELKVSIPYICKELEEKSVGTYQYQKKLTNGLRWKEISYQYINEKKNSIIVTIRDIEEILQKRREEELLEIRFGILFRGVCEGCMEVDLDTQVANLYGKNPYIHGKYMKGDYNTLLVQYANNRISKECREKFIQDSKLETLLHKLIKFGGEYTDEYYVTKSEGRKAYYRRSYNLHTSEDGKQFIVSFTKDITKEKEAYILRRKRELESRKKLEEALAEAKEANEAKSIFLARMSHDIRTPMNAIIGLSNIARREVNQPKRVADCLDKVLTSSEYLVSLINDILEMSKIEAGRLDLVEEDYDIHQVAADVETIMMPQIKDRGLTFVMKVEPEVNHSYRGDELRVRQILLNLLSNAMKFTKESGFINCNMSEINQRLHVIIEDTGIGMSKEFQKHMYEAFERAKHKEVRGMEGSGLGLAIVKKLVDAMNGTIEVDSKLGEGTKFTIDIPIKYGAHISKCKLEEVEADVSGLHALFVEDNEINREIGITLLKHFNMKVDQAVNGRDAIQQYANSKPFEFDIILMDVRMPEIDGLEATRQIRALNREDAKSIPIVAQTANVFRQDVKDCLAAGMNAHIVKPLNPSVVRQTIAQVTKQNKTD